MARRTGVAAVGARQFIVTNSLVDLLNVGAPTDIPALMVCPGDDAKLLSVALTTHTAGTGAFTHTLLLEHGLAAAGEALTPDMAVLAEDAAGVIHTFEALAPDDQPDTVNGTHLQFRNTETGGDITDGAVLITNCLWQL